MRGWGVVKIGRMVCKHAIMFCEPLLKGSWCYPLRSGRFLIAEDMLDRKTCEGAGGQGTNDETISRGVAQRNATQAVSRNVRFEGRRLLRLLSNVIKGALAASK